MKYAEDIAFLLRAKNRIAVLKTLEKGSKISSQMEKETGLYKSHMSRALKELRDRNLIKCINPGDRTYKFYELTAKGKEVMKQAEKIRVE